MNLVHITLVLEEYEVLDNDHTPSSPLPYIFLSNWLYIPVLSYLGLLT